MNSVTVRPVKGAWDHARFCDFPYRLYRNSPYWVPPLRIEQRLTLSSRFNPFFEHGMIQPFLAFDSAGKIVGRIAAVKNGMHLKKYNDAIGFFGFFEVVEDYSAAAALLDAAAQWLQQEGLTSMRGPASPSMNDLSGLLVGGFDRQPAIYMPYNPPYYQSYLERYGFECAMTMSAYYVHRRYGKFNELRPWIGDALSHYPNIRFRPGSRERFDLDVQTVFEIYNEGFSENWGHVPWTPREFKQVVRIFDRLLQPELAVFLDLDEKPAAFIVAVPDLNEILCHLPGGRLLPFGWFHLLLRWRYQQITGVRAVLSGVRKEYQGQGLITLLGLLACEKGWITDYQSVELSWVLKTNKLLRDALDRIGAARDKEYAIYEKRIA